MPGAQAETGSPYNPPADIDVPLDFVLEKRTLTELKIPTILLSHEDFAGRQKPVVVALHGGGMPELLDAPGMTAKEAWFIPEEFHGAPYTLARAGCLVVIIDAWWAGERFRPEYKEIVRNNIAAAVVRGWTETAEDVRLIIDALAEVPGADVTRVGVCGRSGGGVAALMAARLDKRVDAVVSWAGCGDIGAFLRTKAAPEIIDKLLAAAPDAIKQIKAYDPIFGLDALPPRAILLLNNRTDPAVDSSLAVTFAKKLSPFYHDHPELLQCRLRDTDEPTHKMSKRDYAEGCAWLVEHLVKKFEP